MKKIIVFFLLFLCSFVSVNGLVVYADEDYVYLGGESAGFCFTTNGAQVLGISDVLTEKGLSSPAKDIGIIYGDIIEKIDDNDISSASDIAKSIKDKNKCIIIYSRDNEKFIKDIYPVKDISGINKIGVCVREEMTGIGTVTFYKNGKIASLGHQIADDYGNIISIKNGEIFDSNIISVVSGKRFCPGELHGEILKDNKLGSISSNTMYGVFGKLDNTFDFFNKEKILVGNAKIGDAYIYSTIEGNKKEKFSISIIKVDESLETKNFVIKVTDKKLLEKTNGIVQGMSGSPIVQNDKIVGAVTHVFINDSTRGFGISINKMINAL